MLNIKTNIKQFIKKEIKALSDDVNKAQVRTVNDLASSAFTETRKEIRQRINIKDKDLKLERGSTGKLLHQTRINKATFKNPRASIIAVSRRKGRALTRYNAKEKGDGVMFKVKKGKNQKIKGGFIATMRSGHTGVYLRNPNKIMETRAGNPSTLNKHTQAIDEKFGPNQAQLIGSRRSITTIDNHVRKNYAKKYENNFKYYRSRK